MFCAPPTGGESRRLPPTRPAGRSARKRLPPPGISKTIWVMIEDDLKQATTNVLIKLKSLESELNDLRPLTGKVQRLEETLGKLETSYRSLLREQQTIAMQLKHDTGSSKTRQVGVGIVLLVLTVSSTIMITEYTLVGGLGLAIAFAGMLGSILANNIRTEFLYGQVKALLDLQKRTVEALEAVYDVKPKFALSAS